MKWGEILVDLKESRSVEKIMRESGNVFKDPEGEPLTQRITREDINLTLDWLESITGLPLKNNKLGSVGLKASSGDLDLAVDTEEVDKNALAAKLMDWVKSNIDPNANPKEWVKKSGISVHFKTPIKGDIKNGFVQTDFMFGNPSWMKFALKGFGDDTPYSGKHRNILLSSIAKGQGLKWSHGKGLTDRETNKEITKDPDEISIRLLGPGSRADDLNTIESIITKIRNRPDYELLVQDAKETFAKDGLELPEV